ncbi:MAG: RnfABCDGE type electron transport complex subunit B [Omnitrophica bacterium]|nr:RnfABCDGE type electron transport complex subunit B [Candidatus Omnitrophota bacterium]
MSARLLISLLTMGGLGLFLSTILAIANKKLKVKEDSRIKQITSVLPGLNCAACGYPSCHVYAESVVQGKVGIGFCFVGGKTVQKNIADIMKVQVEEQERKLACVRCQGGERECKKRFRYLGVRTCEAVNQLRGGDKSCVWGCLGYGDCVSACPFEALELNDNGIPVVIEENCTACGLCVKACPRDIISLIPFSQKVYLGCVSEDKAKAVKEVCTVGCFACTLCANPKITPGGLIVMENNLPKILVERIKDWKDLNQSVARCPAKCYVTRGEDKGEHNEN